MPKTSDQPRGAVDILEGKERLVQLLSRVEGLLPREALVQHVNEALGAAVTFECPHESRWASGAQKGDLGPRR